MNFETNQFLVAMIIGEPEYRHSGVTNAVTVPFRNYFFEELGMDAMLATALAHNKPIIHYLYATGLDARPHGAERGQGAHWRRRVRSLLFQPDQGRLARLEEDGRVCVGAG